MPFFQIIGITSVGKNLSVAVAFMKKEMEEHYTCVLSKVKNIFYDCVELNVIVTYRELGLMTAIKNMFPKCYHMLCLWNIARCVELYAKRHLSSKKDAVRQFCNKLLKPLICSLLVEEYEEI